MQILKNKKKASERALYGLYILSVKMYARSQRTDCQSGLGRCEPNVVGDGLVRKFCFFSSSVNFFIVALYWSHGHSPVGLASRLRFLFSFSSLISFSLRVFLGLGVAFMGWYFFYFR